jgi:hypothetical protein
MNTAHTVFLCLIWYSEQITIISLKNVNRLLSDAEEAWYVGGKNRMFTYYFDGFRTSKAHLVVCNLLKPSKNSCWLTFMYNIL